MANPEHLAKLKEGVGPWNQWRSEHPQVSPELDRTDLSGANLGRANLALADLSRANLSAAHLASACLSSANLSETNLCGADLRWSEQLQANLGGADLTGANLSHANLRGALLDRAVLVKAGLSDVDFQGAVLCNANLYGANLTLARLGRANLNGARMSRAVLGEADLSAADLTGADLRGADLRGANLNGANLQRANLEQAHLIETTLESSNLTLCRVYGISSWDVRLEGAIQSSLIITPVDQSDIQVDNLEVAQFIYLLLNNQKIRHVIDTITSKVVLILGRFAEDRKEILDAIRDELRQRDYLPVLFDFEKPSSRDLTETISTLAHLARFVIADITDAKSIPQELMAIVPSLTSLPVQPLLLASQHEYGMFEHFKRFPWVLEPVLYDDQQGLLAELSEKVIAPAEAKAKSIAAGS